MTNFGSFSGVITGVNDFWTGAHENSGCYKLMMVQNMKGDIVNFVVAPETYFVEHVPVAKGDGAIGFYDLDAPVPLIYPPQYRALVMAKVVQGANVKVSSFDQAMVSSDGTLKITIGPSTRIVLQNGLPFSGKLENRDLIVIYGPSTKSIPAQAIPYKIIVMCSER